MAMMDRYEGLVDRSRQILGYKTPRKAYIHLVDDGIEPQLAYLAVKGAVVLDKLQGRDVCGQCGQFTTDHAEGCTDDHTSVAYDAARRWVLTAPCKICRVPCHSCTCKHGLPW